MFAGNFSSNLMFSFAPSRFPTGYGDKTNARGIFPNKLFAHELLGLYFKLIYNKFMNGDESIYNKIKKTTIEFFINPI